MTVKKLNIDNIDANVSVTVHRGGFTLNYPEVIEQDGQELVFQRSEVFVTSRKLMKKLAGVLDDFARPSSIKAGPADAE